MMNKGTALPLAAAMTMSLSSLGAAPKELSFTSGGKEIGVEVFGPETDQKAPALVVLHGASGPLAGNRYVRQLASAFAAQGYATFLVHYFDRTGTTYADDEVIRSRYHLWAETINDAISFVAEQPQVDQRRIALMGYSLGGYLSVTHGARDPRIAAVIEIAGGLDEETEKRQPRRMPPTLILHGDADRRVPVSAARGLERWLKEIGAKYEVHIYPGEGHLLSAGAAFDALARGHVFLEKHLR